MTSGHRTPTGRKRVVYTSRIRLKNGRILYAWQYGLRAFRFEVTDKK